MSSVLDPATPATPDARDPERELAHAHAPAPAPAPGVATRTWVVLLALVVCSVIAVAVVVVVAPGSTRASRAASVDASAANARADDAARADDTARADDAMRADDTVPTTSVPEPGVAPAPAPAPAPGSSPAAGTSKRVVLPGGRNAPAISRVPTTDKVIFLGIDDGMVRDRATLDFFRTNQIPFTIFLTENYGDLDPQFWRDAVAAGGAIENHTRTHPDLRKKNWNDLRREICGVADHYQQVFGTRPTLFRPPYGLYDDRVRATAASCGMKALVMWRGATNDGRLDIPGNKFTPGDILLMHWRADLLDNLQLLVKLCKEQGYTIARLQDYIG